MDVRTPTSPAVTRALACQSWPGTTPRLQPGRCNDRNVRSIGRRAGTPVRLTERSAAPLPAPTFPHFVCLICLIPLGSYASLSDMAIGFSPQQPPIQPKFKHIESRRSSAAPSHEVNRVNEGQAEGKTEVVQGLPSGERVLHVVSGVRLRSHAAVGGYLFRVSEGPESHAGVDEGRATRFSRYGAPRRPSTIPWSIHCFGVWSAAARPPLRRLSKSLLGKLPRDSMAWKPHYSRARLDLLPGQEMERLSLSVS